MSTLREAGTNVYLRAHYFTFIDFSDVLCSYSLPLCFACFYAYRCYAIHFFFLISFKFKTLDSKQNIEDVVCDLEFSGERPDNFKSTPRLLLSDTLLCCACIFERTI